MKRLGKLIAAERGLNFRDEQLAYPAPIVGRFEDVRAVRVKTEFSPLWSLAQNRSATIAKFGIIILRRMTGKIHCHCRLQGLAKEFVAAWAVCRELTDNAEVVKSFANPAQKAPDTE